jgi:hypothetical protein
VYPQPVSLVGRRSCWSWAGLALWLANASLALTIAAGLVFGPEIADRAWARGIHVTPAQAAMHAALMAEGFAHHHGATPLPAGHTATPHHEGPSLQSVGGGSTWGTPLAQAVDADLPVLAGLACCVLFPANQLPAASADLVPETPPPEAA